MADMQLTTDKCFNLGSFISEAFNFGIGLQRFRGSAASSNDGSVEDKLHGIRRHDNAADNVRNVRRYYNLAEELAKPNALK